MIQYRPITRRIFSTVVFIVVFSLGFNALGQDGKALFQEKCASCHHPEKDGTGPALKGAEQRVGDKKRLYAWIRNNAAVREAGDPYYVKLYNDRGKAAMNNFADIKDEEIAAILKYVEDYRSTTVINPNNPDIKAASSDNSLLYGILTLILAVITLILLQVNSNLRKLADDKDGIPAGEPVPFYRNKAYIATFAVILFIIGGYYTIQGAIGLGRNKDYQPEQPIYYSHKVHAGTNQISCLYCHGNAYEGKHATVPSSNTCMNCHMAINSYGENSEKLYREDGTAVNGTAEIQKLYASVGWDPATKKYTGKEETIKWVKIHNLPDHVYFNHSQHTKAGKVQCQTCHGPIQEMGEVKQFSDLSMGWCINCHRESKVNFYDSASGEGNKFYSIYKSFYTQMKDSVMDEHGHKKLNPHKMDSVTVEKIGGTECQKCHY
jgi:mono/diheme cytochrome c family protein